MADCVAPVTEVASSAWVPVLVLSIVSFVTAVGSALHAVYSSRKSRLSLAAYQTDVAYLQVSPAYEEVLAVATQINKECDNNKHALPHGRYEKGYPYNYALFFAAPASASTPAFATMNRCRRQLSSFWQGIFLLVEGKQLPSDFLDAERKPWVTRGEAVRQLLEPIDIANFYRRRLDTDGGYLEKDNRPLQYKALAELALQEPVLDDNAMRVLVARLKAARGDGDHPQQ